MAHQKHALNDGTDAPEKTRQLAVTVPAGRVLSKAQKAFNRLIARVEALRAEIKATTARLEKALRQHDREVRPRLDELARVRKELARTLAPFLRDPRLKKASDRSLLGLSIVELIDAAAAHEGDIIDDDLREIFKRLTVEAAPRLSEKEMAAFKEMRAHVESMFGAAGVKIDLSDLGPNSTEEELYARVEEAMRAAREHPEAGDATATDAPAARPPSRTKKQREREERLRQAEEARRRTIGAIYKELAKVLHPDLEPDPERRHEKLALMQELTAAHRANDLHTLLRLELEWLHREEGDIQRLTDEKLAVYAAVLREQVAGLEAERDSLSHHPRFQALVVDDDLFGPHLDLDPAFRKAHLDLLLDTVRHDLARLRGNDGWRAVQALLKDLRAQARAPRSDPF